jgi:hypothetical protein
MCALSSGGFAKESHSMDELLASRYDESSITCDWMKAQLYHMTPFIIRALGLKLGAIRTQPTSNSSLRMFYYQFKSIFYTVRRIRMLHEDNHFTVRHEVSEQGEAYSLSECYNLKEYDPPPAASLRR